MTTKPDVGELYAQFARERPPKKRMGRPPRAVKRVQIALRLEPDMAAAIDALELKGCDNRHAKIVRLISDGISTIEYTRGVGKMLGLDLAK
jgi:hypothetical protein